MNPTLMRKLTSATPSNSALSKARSSLLDGCFCQGFSGGGQRRADYQPWMGYANFVSNGNAENCSPNPLFNVMQYVDCQGRAAEQHHYDGRNADNNPWTAQNVLDFSMPMTSPPGIISRPPASSKRQSVQRDGSFRLSGQQGERVQRHRNLTAGTTGTSRPFWIIISSMGSMLSWLQSAPAIQTWSPCRKRSR